MKRSGSESVWLACHHFWNYQTMHLFEAMLDLKPNLQLVQRRAKVCNDPSHYSIHLQYFQHWSNVGPTPVLIYCQTLGQYVHAAWEV